MTDQQAFIEAINANPTDFETRRVYADLLEERGGNWARGISF